jgi:hypothetical protein
MSDSKPDLAGELPACDKSVRPDIGRSAFQHFPTARQRGLLFALMKLFP